MTRGGTKRKIEIEKRETSQQRSVTCSKRRKTVFSKAADLCLRGGANMAVFVTSPADDSDVVYSFSGYSSASEIAHCYLNGKSPPPPPILESDFGFLSEDPVELYRNCDDLSELESNEDHVLRIKSEVVACIDRKRKLHQNPSSQEKPCPVSLCFDQNPSFEELTFTESSICFDQNPSLGEKPCPESFCFDQNSSSDELPYTEFFCYDRNPSLESFGFDQNPSYEDLSFTDFLSFDQYFSSKELSFPGSFSFDQNPRLACLATEEEAADAYDVEALMKTFGALDSICPFSSDHNIQQLPPSNTDSCGIPFESSVLYPHHNMFHQHYPASTVQVPNQSY